MADNQRDQSEQPQPEQPARPPADCWGDPISDERKAELRALAERQAHWAAQLAGERGDSRFTDVRLTGADVFWLAALALAGAGGDTDEAEEQLGEKRWDGSLYSLGLWLSTLHLEVADLSGAHLERADLRKAHLEGADLSGGHLEGADLSGAHLERVDPGMVHADPRRAHVVLRGAHLEHANLSFAYLKGADLRAANLERADLNRTRLEEAIFYSARLEGAIFYSAHLEGADLRRAHLEGANLRSAHLERADLSEAHLEGKTYPAGDTDLAHIRQRVADFPERLAPADLSGAFMDGATVLKDAVVADGEHGGISVSDVRWGGVNLAVIPDWSPFTEQQALLGDEHAAWAWQPEPFTEAKFLRKQPRKERATARAKHDADQARERLRLFQAAVRANRQLATALRAQGMNEEADHFAYRAQVVQRAVFRQQGKRGKLFFSGFLDFIAGYGYQPLRSVAVYLAVIAVFAVGYWLVGPAAGHTFAPDGALVFSVTSFHGRGFFPGGLELENWITRLAALEAVLGLIIEISFIATFTQRFFGR